MRPEAHGLAAPISGSLVGTWGRGTWALLLLLLPSSWVPWLTLVPVPPLLPAAPVLPPFPVFPDLSPEFFELWSLLLVSLLSVLAPAAVNQTRLESTTSHTAIFFAYPIC